MKKKVGIIKRVSCLGLIFLISINSFAAIVSDNDGSAFITKAEFDSLKNNFQTQIDSYNNSIDSKIDGAIAAYLAGIQLSKEEALPNNYNTLKSLYNIYWNNTSSGFQTSKPTCKIDMLIRWGARVGDGTNGAIDYMYGKSYSGNQVKLPITHRQTYGSTVYNVIDTYQYKQSYFYFLGFFIANPSSQFSNSSSTVINVTGVFKCNGFNPNANKVYNKMDQWWNYKTYDTANWAMAIDGFLTEVNGSEDNSSIYFWYNSGSTYFWDKNNTTDSSSTSSHVIENFDRKDKWHGTGDATAFNGSLKVGGVQGPEQHNLPWCQTTSTFNNFIDSRLNSIFGKPSLIKEGLLLTSFDKPGKIKFDVTPSSAGTLSMKVVVDGTTVLSRTEITHKDESLTATTKRITWDLDSISIPTGKTADLWVVFKPSSSGNKTCAFDTITLTKKDD